MKCPECGSSNIEENDPGPGEHTCRDCGAWIDDEPTGKNTDSRLIRG